MDYFRRTLKRSERVEALFCLDCRLVGIILYLRCVEVCRRDMLVETSSSRCSVRQLEEEFLPAERIPTGLTHLVCVQSPSALSVVNKTTHESKSVFITPLSL